MTLYLCLRLKKNMEKILKGYANLKVDNKLAMKIKNNKVP